ncbi:hypothetical protein GCM10011575_42700 [Microlunatus endophyticus]|uniref:Uncharacterized protein n=1 Tax=Microlunatus endophyticus TaxID=1716077 RepID=A0A917SI58_9ACTN|nr:hypothetical protein GCM10011575_42700 [Microlunatus endophyticus]
MPQTVGVGDDTQAYIEHLDAQAVTVRCDDTEENPEPDNVHQRDEPQHAARLQESRRVQVVTLSRPFLSGVLAWRSKS